MTAISVGGWQKQMPIGRSTYDEWQAAVQEIAPPSDTLTWLYLDWEPGNPWEPVERWCIWQMRPRKVLRIDTLIELEGPHPRSTGHYCAPGKCECAIKMNAWRGGTSVMIDSRQWELFHADGPTRGCLGRRYWIVQGHTGGNLRFFTSVEAKLSRIAGGPDYPPVPGSLDYAPVDRRVIEQVGQRDLMRRYGMMTDFLLRSPEQLDAEEKRGTRLAKTALQGWIKTQVQEVVSEGGRALMRGFGSLPRPVGFKDTTDYDKEFAALAEDDD